MTYINTPGCTCPRCRTRYLTGPAMMITVGVLFLLANYHIARFETTWPVLLLVLGLVKILQTTAPITGHRWPEVPPPAAATVNDQVQNG